MTHVLIVDDEVVLARSIARFLSELGHVVSLSWTLREAEQIFTSQPPDLTLLDVDLPDGNGLDFLARWMTRDPQARFLVMTAHADPVLTARALELGARACVHKPMDLVGLASTVSAVLSDAQAHASPPI